MFFFIGDIPMHVLYIKIIIIICLLIGYLALKIKYEITPQTELIAYCLFFMLVGVYLNYTLNDDAYISLRYAKNFARGHGLVFNVGEKVEGYTSFLWVFLLGIHNKLGIEIVPLTKFLGIGFAFATIIMTYNIICFLYKEEDIKIVGSNYLILFAVNVNFIYWAFSGMEITFYTFLLLSSVYFMLKAFVSNKDVNNENRLTLFFNISLASLFFSLSAMTRP